MSRNSEQRSRKHFLGCELNNLLRQEFYDMKLSLSGFLFENERMSVSLTYRDFVALAKDAGIALAAYASAQQSKTIDLAEPAWVL